MTTNETVRRRTDSVLGALRAFGLVDRFGLTPLFREEALPTHQAVVGRLQRNTDALPPGISADYLALHILAKVDDDVHIVEGELENSNTTQPLTAADVAEFDAILTGTTASRTNASRYQHHVRRLIGGLFAGSLLDAGSEVPQFGGVGRIDLLFQNIAVSGFFDDIIRRVGARGLFVPVECKNYEDDPKNPEVAQLLSRLNPGFATFGIIACRTTTDRDAIFARCAPYARHDPGQWVVVLSDGDFRQMLGAYLAGDAQAVEAPLYEQVRRLALG